MIYWEDSIYSGGIVNLQRTGWPYFQHLAHLVGNFEQKEHCGEALS